MMSHKNIIIFFMFLTGWLISGSTLAQGKPQVFTVFLNDIPYTYDAKVRPCYPVIARFVHPDPVVTRVRMRYPYNYAMFMYFPVNEPVHIKLHEDFMKKGQLSLSDYIAEDDLGNKYGQMTLTYIPVDPANGGICNGFLNS